MVTRTDGRFPEAKAETTSFGTCRPVAVLPPSSTAVRNLIPPSMSEPRPVIDRRRTSWSTPACGDRSQACSSPAVLFFVA